jgi:hypothetical protein
VLSHISALTPAGHRLASNTLRFAPGGEGPLDRPSIGSIIDSPVTQFGDPHHPTVADRCPTGARHDEGRQTPVGRPVGAVRARSRRQSPTGGVSRDCVKVKKFGLGLQLGLLLHIACARPRFDVEQSN